MEPNSKTRESNKLGASEFSKRRDSNKVNYDASESQ